MLARQSVDCRIGSLYELATSMLLAGINGVDFRGLLDYRHGIQYTGQYMLGVGELRSAAKVYSMHNRILKLFSTVILAGIVLSTSLLPAQAEQNGNPKSVETRAQVNPTLEVLQQGDGVSVSWHIQSDGSVTAASAAVMAMQNMPRHRYGGYMLPMSLQTVILPQDSLDSVSGANFTIINQSSSIYRAPLQIAAPLEPKAIDWEEHYESPEEELFLPDSNLFILREGYIRGTRVAVIAFSPITSHNGETFVTSEFEAKVPQAQVFDGSVQDLMNRSSLTEAARSESLMFAPSSFAPTNLAAAQQSIKIHVVSAGIQLVRGEDLIANGVPSGSELSKIQIFHRGTEIAVELWDTGNNGTLDANDSLRFYVGPGEHSMQVGNYWENQEILWLTYGGSNGLRMVGRNVVPAGSSNAALRSTAMQSGIWEKNLLYESTMAGVDGDNWYHIAMAIDPAEDQPGSYPNLIIPLNHNLPLATSSGQASRFRLTGSARTVANRTIQVSLGNTTKTVNWTNLKYYESWSHVVSSTVAHPESIQVTMLPGNSADSIRFDKVYWEQPVNLDFSSQGAAFFGVEGTWRYKLSNVVGDAALYDVTDPQTPQRLIIPAGTSPEFEDGPVPRRYVLTTVSELHKPELSAHEPVTWPTSMRAHGLYIGYKQFHDELQPLLDMRRQQGYEVLAVDLQSVYDSWSFGQISPDAVRNLLQYAHSSWVLPPLSAVGIGDTTVDPKHFDERFYLESSNNRWLDITKNINVFPTFLEETDPWLGTTACDTCFVQLDGDHPLDKTDADFLLDMWFGRFSVQDEQQLADVVSKIVSYETAPDLTDEWHRESVWVADNHIWSDCSIDPAGNFAESTDNVINNYLHPTMFSSRIYFDPSSQTDPSCANYDPVVQPWEYPTPGEVRTAVQSAYQKGTGLITFDGHSNHFQNGKTEEDNSYIVGFNDILMMKNGDRLPIIMQMTCWSGQISHVARSGTTMDERFQRQESGGAVAVVSPAGLSVATSHHLLQYGFHNQLNANEPYQSTLGELVQAGYYEVFTQTICCQDVRRTFLLLGDPLMRALIAPDTTYLPLIDK